MASFDELDEIFKLADENPSKTHSITGEMAKFIIDNSLTDEIDTDIGEGKMTMKIKYRGVTLIWETKKTPWSEINRRRVN